jgi:hypothetical protein
LTRGLMGCFQGVYAHGGFSDGQEKPISAFATFSRPGTHVVLKRTATCYQSLAKLPADIDLLYCVRHPFDTLTSAHRWTKDIRPFHVTPERWLAEYNAFRLLHARQPNRQIFVSRYEDLIAQPDECQRRIADHLGLTCRCRFSDNPDGVRLHADSIAKWRQHPTLLRYITSLDAELMPEIRRFGAEFGYEIS